MTKPALHCQYARCDVLGAHGLAHDVVRSPPQGDMPEAVVLMAGQHEYAAAAPFGQAGDQPTCSHVGQAGCQQYGMRRPLCLKP